jgi:hypothetical protein
MGENVRPLPKDDFISTIAVCCDSCNVAHVPGRHEKRFLLAKNGSGFFCKPPAGQMQLQLTIR